MRIAKLKLFQAAYRSKPGFLCKLLHGSVKINPQINLDSLCQDFGLCLTVVWMRGVVQKRGAACSDVDVVIKADGSVRTWGDEGFSGKGVLIAGRFPEGVVQVVSTSVSFEAIKSDGYVMNWGDDGFGGNSSLVADRFQDASFK
ncbi:unnamed protein product [Polarella glacialis]|uniref:Uncharacterized protein n=1 Tax=Polarella glacialis TaxID=89957 RepID=A0A813DPZ1_POLGL|nr:unnamed protein product [Polarella glacialis]